LKTAKKTPLGFQPSEVHRKGVTLVTGLILRMLAMLPSSIDQHVSNARTVALSELVIGALGSDFD
jgi:hypothetical protein